MPDDGWQLDRRPVREVVRGAQAPGADAQVWPATIPAVRQVLDQGWELAAGVTFLVGENGSGKSTLVEAVAGAYGLDPEGGTPNTRHVTRATESPLREWIQLVRGAGTPRRGFFLRAETMHGYYTHLEDIGSEPDRPPAPDYHALSHGESFLELVQTHLRYGGLWCLDEPEAALSFSSVLVLLGSLHDLASRGAQVLCATHSPQLAALPGARIVEVGEWGLRECSWQDLLMVQHWRAYLSEPGRYLRHVID